MGNRAIAQIAFGPNQVLSLYTHWGGIEEIEEAVFDAIRGGLRLNDAGYFARIVFENLLQNACDLETGYGIYPYAIDDEPGLYVDIPNQTVESCGSTGFSFLSKRTFAEIDFGADQWESELD